MSLPAYSVDLCTIGESRWSARGALATAAAAALTISGCAGTGPGLPTHPDGGLRSAALPVPATQPTGVPAGAQPVLVERIVDGDTIAVRAWQTGQVLHTTSQVTVRLLDVDTPETKKPGEPVQCYGPEATRFTAELLRPGSTAYVLADRERRDRYGRYLLYVWTASGAFVEEEIVRTGHGRAVLYQPNRRYITQLRVTQAGALAAGRGLWSACPHFVR